MKAFVLVGGLAMLAAASAFGDTVCANVSTSGWTNGTLLTDSTDTCTIGGNVFSGFAIYADTGFTAPTAFSLTVSVSGDTLVLATPNMFGTSEDVDIYFQASPGVSQVTLQTGPNDISTEFVCSQKFAESTGSEACAPPNELNASALGSNNGSIATSSVAFADTDYFVKDDSGGSKVMQTFTGSATPEPMTFSLIGVGLLGLGLLGHRRW